MPENRPLVQESKLIAPVREALIAATDIIQPGDEPYVGWSAVLAERIVAALPRCKSCQRPLDDAGICWFHSP